MSTHLVHMKRGLLHNYLSHYWLDNNKAYWARTKLAPLLLLGPFVYVAFHRFSVACGKNQPRVFLHALMSRGKELARKSCPKRPPRQRKGLKHENTLLLCWKIQIHWSMPADQQLLGNKPREQNLVPFRPPSFPLYGHFFSINVIKCYGRLSNHPSPLICPRGLYMSPWAIHKLRRQKHVVWDSIQMSTLYVIQERRGKILGKNPQVLKLLKYWPGASIN